MNNRTANTLEFSLTEFDPFTSKKHSFHIRKDTDQYTNNELYDSKITKDKKGLHNQDSTGTNFEFSYDKNSYSGISGNSYKIHNKHDDIINKELAKNHKYKRELDNLREQKKINSNIDEIEKEMIRNKQRIREEILAREKAKESLIKKRNSENKDPDKDYTRKSLDIDNLSLSKNSNRREKHLFEELDDKNFKNSSRDSPNFNTARSSKPFDALTKKIDKLEKDLDYLAYSEKVSKRSVLREDSLRKSIIEKNQLERSQILWEKSQRKRGNYSEDFMHSPSVQRTSLNSNLSYAKEKLFEVEIEKLKEENDTIKQELYKLKRKRNSSLVKESKYNYDDSIQLETEKAAIELKLLKREKELIRSKYGQKEEFQCDEILQTIQKTKDKVRANLEKNAKKRGFSAKMKAPNVSPYRKEKFNILKKKPKSFDNDLEPGICTSCTILLNRGLPTTYCSEHGTYVEIPKIAKKKFNQKVRKSQSKSNK